MLPLNTNVHAVAHALTSFARQLMNCYQKATPAPAHSYNITASDDNIRGHRQDSGDEGLRATVFLYHMLMLAVFKSERQLGRKDEYNINPL